MKDHKNLLAAWLQNEHTEHMSRFSPEDFPGFEKLFSAIYERVRKNIPIDGTTLSGIAHDAGMEYSELFNLRGELYDALYVSSYEQVKRLRLSRLIQSVAKWNDPEAFVNAMMREIEEATCKESFIPKQWSVELFDGLGKRMDEEPLHWGLSKLEAITAGIHQQNLIVVAARPAVGKTAFALQTAVDVAAAGHRVMFLPLEMSVSELSERILLRFDKDRAINHEHLRKGCLEDGELSTINEIVAGLEQKLKDNLLPVETLDAVEDVETAIKENRPELVIIDQCSQLRQRKRGLNGNFERLSYCTRTLKKIAMKTGVPIMLLHQVNRSGAEFPTLNDLKGSGSFEEDADLVLLLHKLSPEQQHEKQEEFEAIPKEKRENASPVTISVAKQRNGNTGIIYGAYEGARFTFTEA
ncbi:MAG: AAA family ATPase [Firmicutes bacterium]|nr:AAA family ATPase [Bacillota bacterium]